MKLSNFSSCIFLLCFLAACSGKKAQAEIPGSTLIATAPAHLRLDGDFENPLGHYDAMPSFSWQLPADGSVQRQSAYRIVVASEPGLLPDRADLWDSGEVKTDQSTWVSYQGKAFASRQRAYWQVRFWDEKERVSEWSEPASFELGLLHNEDWKGQWIQMNGEKVFPPPEQWTADDQTSPSKKMDVLIPEYLRKQFKLNAPITKARLYVSARGLYEIFLNGSRVGRDYMTPGWTTYRSWIESLTYDVTQQVREGENVIGATIAQGWYAGRISPPRRYTGLRPDLICQLEVTLANGERVVIATDGSWKATNQGPIRFAGIFDGEVYDARREMPGWNSVGFDDSKWGPVLVKSIDPAVALSPKEHFPVRITRELPSLKVTEPQSGKYVFDFGQNMVGWPQLTIPVRAGETIQVRTAEMLKQDGTLYTDNYRTARSTDYYTAARNGIVTWHPEFTFHGFRYVELSGFPAGTKPDASWVKGMVLHSDFERIGHFSSSSDMLNRLQENITWGQRGNFLDVPTDCPQRDERRGWTGDAQVFCPTAQFNYNTHAFWTSWTHSMRVNQFSNGIIPSVIPEARNFKQPGSPGWGDAAVTIPWDVYVRSGDQTILEKNYEMMKRWVAAYEPDARDFIVHRNGFGDWLQPYSTDDTHGETSLDLIATAYYGRCSAIMEQVATILGKPNDAARYARQFTNIRDAFSRKFFDRNGKLTTPFETQTGYLLALGFNLLESGQREEATRNLLLKIEEADGHLRTGFLGTPLLAFVLGQTGHQDIAYQVLFRETYPSWFFSIKQGATTMWERWNSYTRQDGFADAKMNSFNHYAYGAIGQWMYERIAGLAPDPEYPGYRHFFIRPVPGSPLTWAKAELETPYGKALSGWKKSNGKLTIEAIVPPNTTATLIVPTKNGAAPTLSESGKPLSLAEKDGLYTCEVQPGKHEFQINLN
jgi:alpha-L-rhamnosidase